jgi:hypothetical protein
MGRLDNDFEWNQPSFTDMLVLDAMPIGIAFRR